MSFYKLHNIRVVAKLLTIKLIVEYLRVHSLMYLVDKSQVLGILKSHPLELFILLGFGSVSCRSVSFRSVWFASPP